MAEGQIAGIAHGVAANAVCSAVFAVCTAAGLTQAKNFDDPKNWPVWVALIIFGAVGFVGTGANAARLWWKKRRIDPSRGERLTIILADLVGDDSSHSQKQNILDSLERYLGSSIQIISYPEALAVGEGYVDAERANTHAVAQKILKDKRGDLLIWGRVKSGDVLALYFTGRAAETSMAAPYRLVSDAERALELPVNFDRDLGAAIAARIVAVDSELVARQGRFLSPYVESFAKQIEPLVAHPKANWMPEARGAVLHAFGLAQMLAGQEQARSTSLEVAVAAYREALQEYGARGTRDRDGASEEGGRSLSRGIERKVARARTARLGNNTN